LSTGKTRSSEFFKRSKLKTWISWLSVGYGVSAYQHRFSVDADLVLRSKDLEDFTPVLEERALGDGIGGTCRVDRRVFC